MKSRYSQVKVIAFDADDTLWHNEQYFQDSERQFCELLEDYVPQHTVSRELLQTEVENIELYGYGAKAFMLSMIETAIRVSDRNISSSDLHRIIGFGKDLLNKPVVVIDGVEEVLQMLQTSYRLVMATKGDLLDQERKLSKSGLAKYFHHTEVMSEKKQTDYEKLIKHLDIKPNEFLMIGNSIKSDIVPVLNVGAHGIHIPYHLHWAHDHTDANVDHPNFRHVDTAKELLQFFH